MSRESNNDDKALPAPDPDTGSDHDNAPPSLPDGIRDLLDKLPEGERDKVVEIASIMVSSRHEGPLPDGTSFEHYERVLPGAASEILSMAKKEQLIRETVLTGRVSNEQLSLSNDRLIVWVLMTAVIGMVGLTGLAVWLKQPTVAMFLTGLSAVVGIGLRLIGAWSNKNRDGKPDKR